MADSLAPVLVDRSAAVCTITLTVASLTTAARTILLAALQDAAADASVRAVVLTGSGKMFCAGQDLVEHAAALEMNPDTALDIVEDHYNPIVQLLTTMPKPVIAAINGTCAGAAIGLVLACDIRVAAVEAVFLTAFNAIGFAPDSGLSKSLADAVGLARASELIMLNEKFTAEQALAWGMVGRIVPRDEVASTAAALAEKLASGATLAFAETKALLRNGRSQTMSEVLVHEGAAQIRLGRTRDHTGAVTAFLAKQAPVFTAE